MFPPLDAAPLTYALIAVTSLVSLYALLMDQKFLMQSVFHVGAIRQGREYHRMVTAGFLHGSPLHLAVNMFVLASIGGGVEFIYGTGTFALLYVGSMIASHLFALWRRGGEPDYSMVGASGAVSGIVIAYCLYAPMNMLYIFGLVPIPAFLFGILFIGYSMFVMGGDGRIAHEAHLGGAIGGAVLTLLLAGDRIQLF